MRLSDIFFFLFNKPTKTEDAIFVIADYQGLFPIDREYRDLGIEEGWLVLIGYHRDEYNRLVYRYRHTAND